jgi:hypothetical protein
MIYKERNKAILLIAKNQNVSGNYEGTNIQTFKASMGDGEMIILNSNGVAVDAGTDSTLTQFFKVATKLSDGDVRFSDTIDAKLVKKVTVQQFVTGANQVDCIGYNGTTGALEAIDNNLYKINIQMRGTSAEDFSRMTIKHGVYKSDSAATQTEVAAGLTNSLITNFSREGSKLYDGTDVIKFERINSGTSLNTSSGTIAVTKGSKYVTILDSGDNKAGWYNTDGAILVAGDVIRFTAAAVGGVGACYVVSEIVSGGGATTMVLKLDAPYQGATNAAIAAASVSVIATASIGNWGIKLTGTELPYKVRLLNYARSTWTMGLQDFGSATITNTTAMSLGSGYGKWVNEFESWTSLGYGRQYLNVPGVEYPTLYSSTAGTYCLIHFQYTDDYTTELGHKSDAHKELWLACTPGALSSYADADTGIGPVIDAYAVLYKWNIVYSTGSDTATVLAVTS